MKKEYKLVGKVTIPKKKRKEVKSIIQKILYLGGIREKETIEIDGRQCITAGIPKWNAREVISFNYNMFTNTSYEAGRLYLKAGSIKNPCNHDKEYDFVANLIRVVLESYSTTPCYLCCDNIPCFIVDYARVINEMIGKRLSFPNRNKMWKMYYALGKQNEDELMRYKGDKELMLSDNMQNSIERWKRAYGQVTEKEIKKLEMEKALKKLLEDFFYVWNFRVLDTAFVREFLKHKNDDRYKRAMIVLIELMDKETKYFPELTKREANIWLIREIRDADEMIEINAYLGMLRNHLRRKEILGF